MARGPRHHYSITSRTQCFYLEFLFTIATIEKKIREKYFFIVNFENNSRYYPIQGGIITECLLQQKLRVSCKDPSPRYDVNFRLLLLIITSSTIFIIRSVYFYEEMNRRRENAINKSIAFEEEIMRRKNIRRKSDFVLIEIEKKKKESSMLIPSVLRSLLTTLFILPFLVAISIALCEYNT